MHSPSAQGRREPQEAIAGHLYHFRGWQWNRIRSSSAPAPSTSYEGLVQFAGPGQGLWSGGPGISEARSDL